MPQAIPIKCAAILAALFLFAGNADARPIKLAWDPSPEPSATGYRVYYGTESGTYTDFVDVNGVNVTTWQFELPGPQYYFVVRAYDADGNLSDPSLEVGDAAGVLLTNPGDQARSAGDAVSLQLVASGGSPASPVIYSAANLPPGLSINTSTGRISGTVLKPQNAAPPFVDVVTATAAVGDPPGMVSSVQFFWTVLWNDPPVIVNPGSQATIAGLAVALAISAHDVPGDSLNYSVAGLPPGLGIDSDGVISGTIPSNVAGTYNVTVTVSDGAANSQVAFPWVVTAIGALAPHRVVSVDGTGTTVTTPPFSTLVPGELLIAFVASAQPDANGSQTATVTGGGLVWTLVRRANSQLGTSEIWQATAPDVLSDITVSADVNLGVTVLSLTIVTFPWSGGVSASAVASAPSGAPHVSLTTTANGSLVYGVGNDWDGDVVRTPGAQQALVYQVLKSSGDTFWVQRLAAPVAAAGMFVELSDIAPTNHQWNFAAVEIVPRSSLTIGNASIAEGNSGTRDAVFTVTLTPASPAPVTVDYATTNNSAAAGGDYTATTGTLTFPAGTPTQTISVAVTGDTTIEPNETFFVNLSNARFAAIDDGTGVGTIANDDLPAPPTITTASPLPVATAGAAYTRTLQATNGTAPFQWTATTPLLSGLTLSNGGVVTGTPDAPGTFSFTVRATDADSLFAEQVFSLTVAPATDPMLVQQWHLDYSNIQLASANVRPVWPITRGAGVVIGIVDDGLQRTHPDLKANYVASLSRDFNGGDADPSPVTAGTCATTANCRGTAAAGIAAAAQDNGLGGSGVAPLASLAGLRLTAASATDANEAAAFTHELQAIHIENNSWGPSDNGQTLAGPGVLAQAALETATTLGRGGKGRIFVFAAGDGRANADNCNANGYANSRFGIAVGAVDETGQQTSSSESCSALFVSAPSSGIGVTPGLTTTDLVGAAGNNSSGDYTTGFGGTAAAAPVVSGVAALMLARNPALTWRDVQHIFVRSSRRLNVSDPSWTSGPFPHSEKFGFGVVDAAAAVNLAATWTNVAAESGVPAVARTVLLAIPDSNATGVSDNIVVGAEQAGFTVEHVEVELTATHGRRGDLEVTLTSPAGTVSHLATVRPGDAGANFVAWRFRSVRHWRESAAGTWTLRVADRAAGTTGTFNGWTLRIYGVAAPPPPVVEPPPPAPPPPAPPAPAPADAAVPVAPPVVPVPPPGSSNVPGAPSGLAASVFGSTVVLSWSTPASGSTPTTYILEAGSAPGASDVIVYDTQSAATSYTAFDVGRGSYFVRVRAANAFGTGPASNEAVATVGSGAPPAAGLAGPPIGLVARASGSNVTLTWNRSAAGGPPTFFVIEVGSAPGRSDLANFSTGAAAPSFSASGVGAGTYFVRVRAGNAHGVSASSNEAVLVVGASGPGSCGGPPGVPGALRAAVNGSTVTLFWGAATGAPASYVLEAGSFAGGTDIVVSDTGNNASSLTAAGVGAGSYFVRVRARNACGTGGASNEVTVVVR